VQIIKFILVSFLLLTISCDTLIYKRGNGEMIVKTQQVDDFGRISLGGNFEVFLRKGDQSEVTLKVDENLEEFIEIDTYNNTLTISTTTRIKSKEGIQVFISYQKLDRIVSSGACSIFTETPIYSDDLKIHLSGAGMMEMELEVTDLTIKLSGAGMLNIRGRSEKLDLNMSGAGSFDGRKLETKDAHVRISGVGGAKVNVSGDLNARVSGVGSIEYSGNPQNITRNVSGIGKISQAN